MPTSGQRVPWKIGSTLLSENQGVIDLRSKNAYEKGHLKGASHFPLNRLLDNLHELPSRQNPVSLVGSEQELSLASEWLQQKGYRIKYQILADESFFKQIEPKGWLEIGGQSKRLWQPASIVKQFVNSYAGLTQGNLGLDLACGAGRDSVFLTLKGWQMTSVDYSETALAKLQQMASGLDLMIQRQCLDIERDFHALLAEKKTYDLVLVIRYLHRPILPLIPQLLNKKGILLYQTFLQGAEAFGSPKNPRFLLKPGELADVFAGFNILYDNKEILPDGRPTNAFIAQKLD